MSNGVVNGEGATIPALERVGRHDNAPIARRSNQDISHISMLANTPICRGIHGIMIHIVARHIGIFDFDGLTWSDIRQGTNDFVVAKHNDLLDATQCGAIQSGCGIGPSEMGLEFGI